MGAVPPSSYHLSLGGLVFVLNAKDHLLLRSDNSDSYFQFTLDASNYSGCESFPIKVSIASSPLESGHLLFDSGSWRIFARGDTRSLVFRVAARPDNFTELRFLPGRPEVDLFCGPGSLESHAGVPAIRSQFHYPLDQVLAMYLLGDRGLIVHAAGFDIGGRGVLMPGVSGAGKSTITRLALTQGGVRPLSDDRMILRLEAPAVVMHGTPWPGDAGVAECGHVPARHLLFLEQGDHNGVREITPREALARLLPTVSLPWYDQQYLESGLRACDGILRAVPAGVFTFRNEPVAIEVLKTFLKTCC